MKKNKDIFISYKNDGEGRNFAARLSSELKALGYDVYYNPDEQHAGSFPDRLRKAIEACKDFLLVVTQPCLDQLMRHEKVDWVREELLIAYENNKNIIPLLMPGVIMPKDKESMPEDLQFLPDKDSINMVEPHTKSPLELLLEWMCTRPEKKDVHRDTYNSSPERRIDEDYTDALSGENSQSAKAKYEQAVLHFYGLLGTDRGCERNYLGAYKLLEELAEGDSEYRDAAHSMIAEMYYHGVMPRRPQSYAIALEHHEQAKNNSGFSAREAAYLRSRGCGCDFDYESIVEYYSNAIEQGDHVAINGLAKFYMSYGKYHEAADLYRRASNKWPEAEFQLGMLYRNGVLENPPKPDYFKAAFYFQHAISSGRCSAEVYHELGRLYFTPVGDFPKDFNEAEKNFTISADMGNREAQYKLGLMYEYGYVKQDIEKAIHYHRKAADQGVSFSAYHLALLYQNPGFRNYHEACRYAEIAAKKGVMEGEFLFGVFLYYGRGCIADEDRAYKYLVRAKDHGMCAAKLFLDKISEKSE